MVATLDVDVLTGPAATTVMERLVRTERVVSAGRARAAKRAADANQWRQAGEASAASWLAKLAGTTTGQAAASLTAADRLANLPATDTAARTGAISELQAREIASAATADPAAEAELLRRAKSDDAQALKRRCAEVRAAAQHDETAARERIRKARRFRGWTDAEGAFCFAGRGLPEDGAALLAAMKPHQDQAFHTARRRGEREATEAYAYDALMTLARHRCNQTTTTAADEPVVADHTDPHTGDQRRGDQHTGDEHPGDETTGDEHPRDEPTGDPRPGYPRLGDEGAGDERTSDQRSRSDASTTTNGTTKETAPAPRAPAGDTSNDCERADKFVPHQAGNHHPSTHPVGTLFTDDDPEAGHHGVSATADRQGHDRPAAHRPHPGSGDPPAAGGRPAHYRAGPPAKIIVRIDHTALLRGHTVPGEVCDIAGVGPITVTAAREIARDAFLTAVVTHGVNVTHVVHLGRSATAHQRTALQARGMTCAVPGCGTTTGLEIDHVDGWAITRRTHLDHLDWLCHHHHGQKTHHSYRLAGPPGQRTWHPPPTNPG